MTTHRITLDNGEQYDLTLVKVAASTGPTAPNTPTTPSAPTTPTTPTVPVVAGPNQVRSDGIVSLKFTNEIRTTPGAVMPSFPLGVDQEIAIEVYATEFPNVLFSLFNPEAGIAMAISNKPWHFPVGGVRPDHGDGPLAVTVGGANMQQQELRVQAKDLPTPTPQGTLFINARWSVATGWGPNAPMRNFLKERGLTIGSFQLRKDQ
jgi:hypothetical protein